LKEEKENWRQWDKIEDNKIKYEGRRWKPKIVRQMLKEEHEAKNNEMGAKRWGKCQRY